jgi:hypothetical protein
VIIYLTLPPTTPFLTNLPEYAIGSSYEEGCLDALGEFEGFERREWLQVKLGLKWVEDGSNLGVRWPRLGGPRWLSVPKVSQPGLVARFWSSLPTHTRWCARAMPTFRRKRVVLVEPSSTLLHAAKTRPEKEVYYLAQTGEIFETYECAALLHFYLGHQGSLLASL